MLGVCKAIKRWVKFITKTPYDPKPKKKKKKKKTKRKANPYGGKWKGNI
jgi:hypothetical protein|tara:strand:- start:1082 stop:1228 length:147 start_codon:yes stop_codon:yes gene_type:complete